MMATDNTAVLSKFNGLCAEHGLLDRRDGMEESDRADGITDATTLLRFLKANRMDVSAALKQFREATKFHCTKNVTQLYDLINVDDFEDTRKLYPHWTGRRDSRGLPIFMIDVAHLDQEAISHWRETTEISSHDSCADINNTRPDMAQRACVLHDYITRFVFPLCSAMHDRPQSPEPVSRSVYLIDASSLGFKQAWDLRDFAREITWILSTCYPETIDRIHVCNAPTYFSQMWNILKKFVDPVTAEKIVVLKSVDVYPVLNQSIHHDDIPTQFGGGFDFSNGMLPNLCPAIQYTLNWSDPSSTTLPPGPIKWKENGDDRIAIATGTVDGVQRAIKVASLVGCDEKCPEALFS
ncbi:CRAL/TRIO domain protein [Talaromyces stipitatus ATCC 10500]|uniref:CRAL/TRIO domain protein n=1 Tax=Talaromyces stipitatus (strain ATCC 10500 / CBS 375.48 / QM 6759 / NRRL 1006) TaxID=441959 RepID=B8MPM3_TALSN|nr:CRAL/TRIO domain protein [Talaromyces stipitatus ATCC 10500]EED14462.1 CRAL/TRIO domain protein [Talaromyces stipitatus ATCC 10500]